MHSLIHSLVSHRLYIAKRVSDSVVKQLTRAGVAQYGWIMAVKFPARILHTASLAEVVLAGA